MAACRVKIVIKYFNEKALKFAFGLLYITQHSVALNLNLNQPKNMRSMKSESYYIVGFGIVKFVSNFVR